MEYIVNNYMIQLAQSNYSCDAYGANAYGECPQETTSPGANTGSGSPLANTGFDVIIPFALGAVLLLSSVGIVIRSAIKKRRNV